MPRARITLCVAAAALLDVRGAVAQELEPSQYTNLATYSISIPLGDTRQFSTSPSWLGIGWEGQWLIRAGSVAGVALGVHNFYDRSDGTKNYEWGAATGEQVRDLLVGTFMATSRWFPSGTAGRGMFVGIGAGGVFAQQTHRLGVMPQFVHSAVHLAVAPEAGFLMRLFHGVDLLASARYTLPTSGGSYLGGEARSFQYVTLNIGLAEH